MMKKVLVIRNAYQFDFGGGERIPVELAVQLQKLNYSPVLVSRSQKLLEYGAFKQIPAIRGWWWSSQTWIGKRKLLFPLYILWMVVLIPWYILLILRTGADVVCPQSRDDFIAATIAARLLRKRVVWTDHADLKYIFRNSQKWLKNPIGKSIYRLSKYARTVIIVSKNELDHINESLGHSAPENYQVIYNGVTSEKITPKKRASEDDGAVIFAATSRLVTTKGIGELIEAFRKVNVAHENARLWLFGEGPDEKEFKKRAEGEKNIIFWGFPEDSMSFLASVDVFVHPSYHEGFSISLIEAAKLGLPIIACNVGGNPELVEHEVNGLLIPPRDESALAEAMEKLLNNEDLRQNYGKNARKIYEDNFQFENIVKEKIVPLYE